MKPISDMTLQEIFDHCVTHLIKQGEPSVMCSMVGPPVCAYRGAEKGSRCAVGIFIEDKNYSASLEGKAVDNPNVLKALNICANGIRDKNEIRKIELLMRLQRMHDGRLWFWEEQGGISCEGFKELAKLAKEFEIGSNILCQKKEELHEAR